MLGKWVGLIIYAFYTILRILPKASRPETSTPKWPLPSERPESCHRWRFWMRVSTNLRWQNSCLWKGTPIQNKPYIILLQFDTMLDVDVYISYACVLLCNLRLRRHFSWYFYYTNSCRKNQMDYHFIRQCFDFPGADFLPQKHSRADHSGPVSLAENLRKLSLHWFSHVWEQSMTGRVEVQVKRSNKPPLF